jgi:hypothetical protein
MGIRQEIKELARAISETPEKSIVPFEEALNLVLRIESGQQITTNEQTRLAYFGRKLRKHMEVN